MSRTVLALSLLFVLAGAAAEATTPEELARRKAVEHQKAGQEALNGGRPQQAVLRFRQAIETDPLLIIAHYGLGQALMALKQYPEAVTAYEGCVAAVERLGSIGQKEREERDRDNQDELQELKRSIVQLRTGQMKLDNVEIMIVRIEERIRVLEDMRMKGREPVKVPAEVYLGLGSAHFRQNRYPEAEKAYLEAVKANSKLGAAHNNLAVIYMLTGRYAESHEAVEAAEKAGFAVNPRMKADLEAREKAAKQ